MAAASPRHASVNRRKKAPEAQAESRPGASRRSLILISLGTLFFAACSAAAVIASYPASSPQPKDTAWAALVVGVLLVALHLRPRRGISARDSVESIQLDEVLFVPALVMLLPWQTIAVMAAATVAGSLSARRNWVKAVFNLGEIVIAASVGLTVVRIFGVTPSEQPGFGEALVGMGGAFAFTACSALLVRLMVSYASGAPLLPLLKEMSARLVPWTGAVILGGIGAIAVGADRWSALLVLGVVAFVHRAYAASLTEQAARQQSERMQQAIAALRSRTDPEQVSEQLLSTARDLLGAGSADIVPDDVDELPRSLSAPLYQGHRLRVSQRRGIDHWDDRDRDTLLTLAGVAGDVLRSVDLITRLRTITNSQSEAVIALDLDARITFVNPAAVHMLGASNAGELLDQPIQNKLQLRHRRQLLDFEKMVAHQAIAQDADASLGPPGGETLDIAYSMTPLRAEDAHVGAVLVMRDVTERRAFQDELTWRALHDELTELPNRRLLLERLDHALTRSTSTGLQHGLLFMDLDRFKLVNDSYGHLAGDKLLVQVANRLRSGLSPSDSIARMSGDEFVVLVEDIDSIEKVIAVAERLLQMLEEPFEVDNHHIFMSASIGVGLTRAEDDRDNALATVDSAAYAAKASGRNCYRVATDASVDRTRARLDLEVSLRQGLDENELELYYQPIVTTETQEIIGVEALLRWHSARRGLLFPQQFVPLAEETGLIVPMGRWVLEEACRALQQWTLANPQRRRLTMSVNLSALQFSQHRLVEHVAQTLGATGLPASQLCLEITETVLMTDTTATQATLDALNALGVKVAIDDFGTGYSSLSYLKRFPIDVVKLDQTFVEGVVTDPADTEIATAIIRLAGALHMTTVAEGVETDTQRRMLAQLGCPLMQGYLTSRPLPQQEFLDFWDEKQAESELGDLSKRRSQRSYQRRGL